LHVVLVRIELDLALAIERLERFVEVLVGELANLLEVLDIDARTLVLEFVLRLLVCLVTLDDGFRIRPELVGLRLVVGSNLRRFRAALGATIGRLLLEAALLRRLGALRLRDERVRLDIRAVHRIARETLARREEVVAALGAQAIRLVDGLAANARVLRVHLRLQRIPLVHTLRVVVVLRLLVLRDSRDKTFALRILRVDDVLLALG